MCRIFAVVYAFRLLNVVEKQPAVSLSHTPRSLGRFSLRALQILYPFLSCFQGKGTVKTYWLIDCARRTPHRHRRSFRRLRGPMEQSSGFLGILEPPPSPCRLSRTSSLRRTMKAIQSETPVLKGRHIVDVIDKSDDMTQTSFWYLDEHRF